MGVGDGGQDDLLVHPLPGGDVFGHEPGNSRLRLLNNPLFDDDFENPDRGGVSTDGNDGFSGLGGRYLLLSRVDLDDLFPSHDLPLLFLVSMELDVYTTPCGHVDRGLWLNDLTHLHRHQIVRYLQKLPNIRRRVLRLQF